MKMHILDEDVATHLEDTRQLLNVATKLEATILRISYIVDGAAMEKAILEKDTISIIRSLLAIKKVIKDVT